MPSDSNSEIKNSGWVEGKLVTGRSWDEYEKRMGINPEIFRGETVLNFGAGGSNIGQEIKDKGIDTTIVDLDLTFDPLGTEKYLTKVLPLRVKNTLLRRPKPTHDEERTAAGLENRQMIQANGRELPFRDRAFKFVLASWSTYQVPQEQRPGVFQELMRVGDIIHISPIHSVDFEGIRDLADNMGFEVVACKYEPVTLKKDYQPPFRFNSIADYDQYKIRPDHIDEQSVLTDLSFVTSIILKRKLDG